MNIYEVNNPNTIYKSPKGREFRTISIERIPNTSKWINGSKKSLFKVLIKYLDNDSLLWLMFDYNDNLKETRKNV